MKGPVHILRRIWQRAAERRRRARFAASLRHVSGPATLDITPQDVLAIVLVKNGGYYLSEFLAYYRQIGILPEALKQNFGESHRKKAALREYHEKKAAGENEE